jgi:ABC-type multidrug transport system fused ATPase/permease subunit
MRLPRDFRSVKHVNDLSRSYKTARPMLVYPRLLMALMVNFKFRISVVMVLALFKGGLRIGSIVLLKLLLNSLIVSNGGEPFMWVGIIAAFNILIFITHGILYYATMKLGWIWKMAATGFVYNNLFELKSSQLFAGANGSLGTGKLVNLISNDVGRLEEFCVFAPYAIISVLEGIGVLVVLAVFLNVESAFAGVGVSLLFLPIQTYLGGVYARIRSRTAEATDKRVRFISEVIEGISSVKCFGWEIPFISNIGRIRKTELNNIVKSQYVKAVNMALYCFGPAVANFATFAVYWRTGGELTIPLVFFGISMLQSLRETFGRAFSRAIESTSETISACHRIEQFLDLFDEADRMTSGSAAAARSTVSPQFGAFDTNSVAPLVSVDKRTFSYSATGEGFCLKDISLSVSKGELVMVVGSVGAGKSTLLNALLGELNVVGAADNATGPRPAIDSSLSIAYCAQKPWIVAATVKSNIVLAGQAPRVHLTGNTEFSDCAIAEDFDEETDIIKPDAFKNPEYVDERLYKLAIKKSRIAEDMKQWEHGDLTEIGERGISVSGGQKARIALARAIYADSDGECNIIVI